MSEKGYCKFCQSYDDVVDQIQEISEESLTDYEFDLFGGRFQVYNYIRRGELVFESACNDFAEEIDKIKINFCPMCGRPLKTTVTEK